MIELFWACVARLLFRWRWLTEKLILSALNRPHRLQLGDYMGRYWLLPRGRLPFAIRIHHIKRPDYGEHQHNHPGTFRTIILRGWYIEKRGEQFYPRVEGCSALMPKNQYHEIIGVSKGGVLTMVIEWGWWKGRSWGFLEKGQHVDHEDYTHYSDR